MYFGAEAAAQERRIVDRIVAVVDGMLITQSDIDGAAALMPLKASEPGTVTEAPTPAEIAVNRLIERRLIQRETQNYPGVDISPEKVFEQMRILDDKYRSEGGLQGLASRGNLSMEEIKEEVQYQLRIGEFMEVRFLSFIKIEEEDIAKYYVEILPGILKKSGLAQIPPLEAVRQQIHDILKETRLQQELDRWIQELVKKAEIQRFAEKFSMTAPGRDASGGAKPARFSLAPKTLPKAK